MDYSKVTSRLEYITRMLGWLLSQSGEGSLRLGEPGAERITSDEIFPEGDEDFERN
jgi:hypothetical protein